MNIYFQLEEKRTETIDWINEDLLKRRTKTDGWTNEFFFLVLGSPQFT